VLGLGEVDRLLTNLLGDLTFEELPCPFAVTAVDLVKGQSVILRQGRVVDAIMSTIALPGIFPPRKWGELELVDGGLINPVPVGLARSLAPNLPVVAVSLNRPPRADVDDFAGSPLPALDRLSRWRLAQALQVVLRSIDISGRLLTELRLEVDQPEVIIRPQVYHIGLLDRVDVSEVAALGEQAAEEALDELRAVVSLPRRLARTLRPVNLLSRLNRNDS
jgi:NTE family protein